MNPPVETGKRQAALGGRVTQNISLSPDEQRIAKELAEKNHGGNVSHLFRRLLKLAWAMENGDQNGKAA